MGPRAPLLVEGERECFPGFLPFELGQLGARLRSRQRRIGLEQSLDFIPARLRSRFGSRFFEANVEEPHLRFVQYVLLGTTFPVQVAMELGVVLEPLSLQCLDLR